jgi:hypothetical protein
LKEIVFPIAQQDQTIMVKLASLVLPRKDGMEPNVLTDVILVKSGVLLHKAVSVQVVNFGMDMHALSVQTVKLGALILNHVNAQFPQHGMESLV